MSNYNTQLQSNNIDLQAILNSINELPEVSSGNVETCIVTLTGGGPMQGIEKVFYTNGSSSIQEISFPDFRESISITVIKNSIIFTYQIATYTSDNAIALNAGSEKAYFVSGDTTITSM